MSNIIVGALIAIPTSFLAWLAYNWAGKPILDVRSARIDALKTAELYGFIGYGYTDDETKRARDSLGEAATSLRSLHRSQPWTSRLYCRVLNYDLETAASILFGLVGLVGAHLNQENRSRRDSVDAIHLALNACRHLSAQRVADLREKLATALALPRA